MNLLFFLDNNGVWSWRGTSQIHFCGWQPVSTSVKMRRRGRTSLGRGSLSQCQVRGVPISPCVLPSPMMGSFATYQLLAHTIQNASSHFLSIGKNTDSTRRERAVEAWHESVCHNLGQCCFPPLSPCEWMVCSTASYYDAIPPCILAFSEPNRGVLLCLEVEGVWSPAIWADAPPGGNECGLPGNRCRGLPGMDTPCKEYFPRCIARENIQCDVDENLWHNRQERMD